MERENCMKIAFETIYATQMEQMKEKKKGEQETEYRAFVIEFLFSRGKI